MSVPKKSVNKSLEDLHHDMRGALSVMLMNLELFVMSPEYKKGGAKVESFVKLINKQIDVLTEKLKSIE
jgi:hypothetical protein